MLKLLKRLSTFIVQALTAESAIPLEVLTTD